MGQCWTRLGKGHHRRRHLAGGKVQLVTKIESWEEKLSEAKQNKKIVVAKFSATWCTPCKEIASTYRELADKYSSLVFLAVDVDEMAESNCLTVGLPTREFSTSWDIKATPTFYFLRDGQPMDKLVGANKVELQKKLAAIAESTSKL